MSVNDSSALAQCQVSLYFEITFCQQMSMLDVISYYCYILQGTNLILGGFSEPKKSALASLEHAYIISEGSTEDGATASCSQFLM